MWNRQKTNTQKKKRLYEKSVETDKTQQRQTNTDRKPKEWQRPLKSNKDWQPPKQTEGALDAFLLIMSVLTAKGRQRKLLRRASFSPERAGRLWRHYRNQRKKKREKRAFSFAFPLVTVSPESTCYMDNKSRSIETIRKTQMKHRDTDETDRHRWNRKTQMKPREKDRQINERLS